MNASPELMNASPELMNASPELMNASPELMNASPGQPDETLEPPVLPRAHLYVAPTHQAGKASPKPLRRTTALDRV
jgi:hypothetical protein